MLNNFKNRSISVRPYKESDLSSLEKLDMFIVLQIKYHGSVKAENVLCAVEDENIIGAGILTLFPDNRVEFSTYAYNADLKGMLIDCLITRFLELKKENNEIVLRTCIFSDELAKIQSLLKKGFIADNIIMVMKYDLSKEIAHYSMPDEIKIKPYEFTDKSMLEYINAVEESGLLPLKDSADSWFRTGAPGFTCFAAFHSGKIIGSVTILDISEECGATEFIFTSSSYRRQNIARELIATALMELKNRGKKQASLTVFGTNLPAINLYLSIGYCLTGNLIELKHR